MNWGLQSKITHPGSSQSFYTQCKNNLTIPSTVTIVYVRMKWALLDTESTTIIIVSYPENLESLTMKSTLKVSHQAFETRIEQSSLTRGLLMAFMQKQRSQVLMYCFMYLNIWGHQQFQDTSSNVFHLLGSYDLGVMA